MALGRVSATSTVLAAAPTPTATSGATIMLAPGWNLVALPMGTLLPDAAGALYTWQPGDTGYEVATSTRPGLGYWLYSAVPLPLTLGSGTPLPLSLTLPPGQWAMVGDPSGDRPALVSGADVVLSYTPQQGYQPVTSLQPGQAAWVLSAQGGTLSVTPQAPTLPDLAAFQALAQQAPCAQTRNQLFLIDGQQVFWAEEGFCSDAGYAYTLYGSTPDEVLCKANDSIAGPQRRCQPGYQALFDVIVAHLDAPDLGLGPSHTVQPIPLA